MKIDTLLVGPLQTNCYILGDENTKQAIVVDPGFEAENILGLLRQQALATKLILLTHGHFDHMCRAFQLQQATGAMLYVHPADESLMLDLVQQSAWLDLPDVKPPASYELLKEGQVFGIGDIEIKYIHTPGHTPGSVCYIAGDIILAGDTLFRGSIGRTDLPGGSFDQIIRSIKERLFVLPDDYTVYTGHGPQTSIGAEKQNNPFVS